MSDRFDDANHTMALSEDGSYTAYSCEYKEHYHSTRDGALHESLYKHVLPAFAHTQHKKEIAILDICYGLGFNTLVTLLHFAQHAPKTKLSIYAPELDAELIAGLKNFVYPEVFAPLEPIIEALSTKQRYEGGAWSVEIFLGDARNYVKRFRNFFDIVYQDAFSPSANPALWTQEYFADIRQAMKSDAILTTYSTALKTRLALDANGFFVYLNEGEKFRNATVATLMPIDGYKAVDMQHKRSCNPDVKPLCDAMLDQ